MDRTRIYAFFVVVKVEVVVVGGVIGAVGVVRSVGGGVGGVGGGDDGDYLIGIEVYLEDKYTYSACNYLVVKSTKASY